MQIETLKVDVDTTKVKAATAAMNRFAESVERAAAALEKLNNQNNRAVTIETVGDISVTKIDGSEQETDTGSKCDT